MKVSHILYKVKNLDAGVEKFRQEGFTVEYGTKKSLTMLLFIFQKVLIWN